MAFDVPEAWHEFYLDVPFKFFAAYGPIEGGKSDYVAVAPVPPDLAQRPSMEILGHLMPPADRIDRVRVVDVNGLPAFSVSGTTGKDLEGELTVVEGRQGVYFLTCQSVREMRDEVTRGCGTIKASLVEVRPSPIEDPQGCTERELTLLRSVPLPDGSSPENPTSTGSGTDRGCDLSVSLPPDFRDDIIAILSDRLRDAGWHPSEARLDRTLGTFDVWQMVADRDFDLYLVEAYVDNGVTDHFFVTVGDG